MTRRRDKNELEKVTVNLIQGQFSQLGILYPQIGASAALRTILDGHLKKVKARMPISSLDIDIPSASQVERLIND